MEFIFYIIIGVVVLLRFLISNKQEQAKKNARRPVRNAPAKGKRVSMLEGLLEDFLGAQPQSPKSKAQGQRPPAVPQQGRRSTQRQRLTVPEWKSEVQKERENNHFSEESLAEEFRRLHGKGKTLKHHTHDYFDPLKDRQVASRHDRASHRKHPLAKKLRSKKNVRDAFIMAELLERKS